MTRKNKVDRMGKTQEEEKEQRWRKGGVEGEHKHEDTARNQKRRQKKVAVGEDRKEMMVNRSIRIEKEKKWRSRSTRRGVVRSVEEYITRDNKGNQMNERYRKADKGKRY